MVQTEELTISPLTSEDYEGCFSLLDKHLSFGLVDLQSYTKRQQDNITLTAHLNGVLIGCIEGTFVDPLKELDDTLIKHFPYDDTIGTFYISHLVVHPDFRKIGVGSSLLTALLDTTKSHAVHYLALGWLKSGNKWDAGGVFKSKGFNTIFSRDDYYKGKGYHCDVCAGFCECGIELVIKENSMG